MKNQILPHDHGYNEEKVAQHMPTENEIAGVSEAMKQLGIPAGCGSSGCCATVRNAY